MGSKPRAPPFGRGLLIFFFKFAHGVTGGSNWLDDVVRPSDVADGGRVTWRYGQPCCLCVGWWRAGHMWPMAAG
jgi:hypothetical protein